MDRNVLKMGSNGKQIHILSEINFSNSVESKIDGGVALWCAANKSKILFFHSIARGVRMISIPLKRIITMWHRNAVDYVRIERLQPWSIFVWRFDLENAVYTILINSRSREFLFTFILEFSIFIVDTRYQPHQVHGMNSIVECGRLLHLVHDS